MQMQIILSSKEELQRSWRVQWLSKGVSEVMSDMKT